MYLINVQVELRFNYCFGRSTVLASGASRRSFDCRRNASTSIVRTDIRWFINAVAYDLCAPRRGGRNYRESQSPHARAVVPLNHNRCALRQIRAALRLDGFLAVSFEIFAHSHGFPTTVLVRSRYLWGKPPFHSILGRVGLHVALRSVAAFP